MKQDVNNFQNDAKLGPHILAVSFWTVNHQYLKREVNMNEKNS